MDVSGNRPEAHFDVKWKSTMNYVTISVLKSIIENLN